MRQDIEVLEKQYSELMARTQPLPASTSDIAADLLVCTCCTSIPCIRELYRELSVKKEELRTQNDALEEQILEHLQFHDKVAFIVARQVRFIISMGPSPPVSAIVKLKLFVSLP